MGYSCGSLVMNSTYNEASNLVVCLSNQAYAFGILQKMRQLVFREGF